MNDQRPVGYVSQDFLDGKWSMDHIAKSDEGQISRTIPVFAKPPQRAPDVAELVDALVACAKASSADEVGLIVDAALSAYHDKQEGKSKS